MAAQTTSSWWVADVPGGIGVGVCVWGGGACSSISSSFAKQSVSAGCGTVLIVCWYSMCSSVACARARGVGGGGFTAGLGGGYAGALGLSHQAGGMGGGVHQSWVVSVSCAKGVGRQRCEQVEPVVCVCVCEQQFTCADAVWFGCRNCVCLLCQVKKTMNRIKQVLR